MNDNIGPEVTPPIAPCEPSGSRPNLIETDLAAITADIAGIGHWNRPDLTLTIDCPQLSRPVLIDPDHWRQVVAELVSNACKYTESGGIHVSLREEGSSAVLTVRDTGIGIGPEDLPHILEAFYGVAMARGRTPTGAGLGLTVIDAIVKIFEGSIEVETELGRGSIFRVRIPFGPSLNQDKGQGGVTALK